MNKESVIKHVSKRIKEARDEKRGMPQAELARRIDGSSSAVLRYEKGENEIPLHRLMQVAEALDIDLSFFLQDLSSSIRYDKNAEQTSHTQKWIPAQENGDWAEMAVRLRDLVEAAPRCQIFVSVSDTGTPPFMDDE